MTIQGASANLLHFEQFSGAGQLSAGANIVITGDKISLDTNVGSSTTPLESVNVTVLTGAGKATLNSIECTNNTKVLGNFEVTSGTGKVGGTLEVGGKLTAKVSAQVDGSLQLGTPTDTTRTEKLIVAGSAYVAGNVTLTGIVSSTGNGRSTYTDSVAIGTYESISTAESTESSTSALVVKRDAYVFGKLRANGATYLNSTIAVTGTSAFTGDLVASNDVKAKTLHIDTTAEVLLATTLGSTLSVAGAATLSSTLAVGTTSLLTGRVEVGAADLTDVTKCAGTVFTARADSKLGVAGGVWIDGVLTVYRSCTLSKNITDATNVGDWAGLTADIPSTRASSKLRVAGSAYVDTSLYVAADASIGGNAAVAGTSTVTGVTSLKSRTDIGTVPETGKSTAMLAVYGSTDLRGATVVGDAFLATNTRATTIADAKLAVNGSAYVEGSACVVSSLTLGGAATVGGSLGVTGTSSLAGCATFTPATTTGTVVVAQTAITGVTTFSGTTGDASSVNVDVPLTVSKTSTLSGNVTMASAVTVQAAGSLTCNGTATFGSTSQFNGNLTVASSAKLVATGVGSQVGYLKFDYDATLTCPTVVSSTTTAKVSFVDNTITTTGDVTCTNVSASTDVTATGKGTFNAGCYSTSFYATSDARLKREVNTVTDALATCSKLRGVTFKWVTGADQREQLGVIAQETQQVYPSLVSEHEGYLRVDYPKLVGLLIEAVKELDERTRPVAAS
jgi:hypothetical protein